MTESTSKTTKTPVIVSKNEFMIRYRFAGYDEEFSCTADEWAVMQLRLKILNEFKVDEMLLQEFEKAVGKVSRD